MDAVFVYDLFDEISDGISVNVKNNFIEFRKEIIRRVWCGESRDFVVCTTDREVINDKNFSLIEAGDTLLLLKDAEQEIPGQFSEKINFEPHYDVLVKSGLYEYYASKGRKPLPYALAELIDNALSATANNEGKRSIDLRFYLDTDKPQNSVILVVDNGNGMKSQDLANWAKYKYSKFNRITRDFANNQQCTPPRSTPKKSKNEFPRYLNSQISYFGAGGKQSVFFIGNAVRMISKSKMSKDVHELFLSESEFKKKQTNREKIFETNILNRPVADASHIGNKIVGSDVLRHVINEENNHSFTCVAITEVHKHHVDSLNNELVKLATQLAHIYHYYIHGPDGNVKDKTETDDSRIPDYCKNLEITVSKYDITKLTSNSRSRKANGITVNLDKPSFTLNLRDIENDMQTMYVRTSVSTFEFRAQIRGTVVEGVLRYHPFLYDKETYPKDSYSLQSSENTANDEELIDVERESARGSRPIFECFWNGRLIPYDSVQTLEWCMASRKGNTTLPSECFSRISGVLWTNDEFEVTQNKLTFKDSFEKKLREDDVAYTFLHCGYYRRGIEEQFKKWLENCHQVYDKEIKFLNFQGLCDRKNDPNIPKSRIYPWSRFNGVQLANKTFKKDQMVKTIKTSPIMVGKLTGFLLWNDWGVIPGKDHFGTSGFFEIKREPASLYGETKIYPLSRLDVEATKELVDSFIAKDEERLPALLEVTWPENIEVTNGSLIKAGTAVGPIKVDVMDKQNKTLGGRLPGNSKKAIHVSLTLYRRENGGKFVIIHHAVATTRSASWFYWFKQIDANLLSKPLGEFKMVLQSCLDPKSNSNQQELSTPETTLGGRAMPSKTILFKVVEGDPKAVDVETQRMSLSQRIGVPFNVPLSVFDNFGNKVSVTKDYKVEVKCKERDVTATTCEGTFVNNGSLYVKRVVVKAKLPSENGKEYTLNIKVDEICKKWTTAKIVFKPGVPAILEVFPEEPQMIENGTLPKFGGLLFDCSGNPVTHRAEKDLVIHCNFFDINADGKRGELLCGPYNLDFVTGPDGKECALKGTPAAIQLTNLEKGVQKEILAVLNVKGHPAPAVEKKLLVQASCNPTSIKLFCSSEFDESLSVEITKDLEWTAGSMIKNIYFKIYDDIGNELQKPNLSQSNVKVSWASANEVARSDLKNYRLPNIKVATSTEQVVYQYVNLICVSETNAQKQSVLEFQFSLKPRPGLAAQLKVTMPSSTEVPAGEALPYDIEVKVADKHMNGVCGITEESCSNLKVSCDSAEIDESELRKELGQKEGVMLIKNLKFKDTTLGLRNITLQFDELKEIIVVEAVAGAPKKLKWEFNTQWDGKVVTVSRNGYLDIALQLYDEFDNKCPIADLVTVLGLRKEVDINEPMVAATNSDGKAYFGRKIFSLKSDVTPGVCPLDACQKKCFGVFPFASQTTFRQVKILSPVIKLHILCDITRASKFNIGYAGELEVVAGEPFPSFYVSMLAEDDETTVTTVTLEQLQLELTCNGTEMVTALCVEDGAYTFENIMKKEAGEYKVRFIFQDPRFSAPLQSETMSVNVLPSIPTTFSPINAPNSALNASNTTEPNNRRILQGKQLKFVLTDEYGNVVSSNDDKYNGILIVDIDINWSLNENRDVNKEDVKIPKFQGNETRLQFDIKHGSALVTNIMLQEQTPGDDGFMYCLRFTAKIEGLSLDAFALPFTFYNEAEKLFETVCLEKKKEEMKKKIHDCDERNQQKRKELNEIIVQGNEARMKENTLYQRLREVGCAASDVQSLCSVDAIQQFTEARKAEKRKLEINDQKRMRYTGEKELTPAENESGVLGKIGHLALLDDPIEARVLSWHLQGDMDCIVTTTTEKAKELNARYRGAQQLLPIEGIFRGNLPDWNSCLPHQRVPQLRNSYRPPGNPVPARTLFHFPNEVTHCRTVFANLLGETILMDTMSEALEYRKTVVKFTTCPTILTRSGERLRNSGKFGGFGNKMHSRIQYVFRIAPNRDIQKIQQQISILNELHTATQERVNIQKKLEETEEKVKVELMEIDRQKTEFRKQFDECDAKIRELRRTKRGPSTSIDSLRGSDAFSRRRI